MISFLAQATGAAMADDAPHTLISASNLWALLAIMILGTGLSIWAEQTFKWAAKLSGPVIGLILAMLLSNLYVVPMEAPVYGFPGSYLVPIAIPLLLFRANIFRIVKTAGTMFAAFHISAFGTLIGAAIATVVMNPWVENMPHAAGIMTGSYIGGGVNFAAVSESFDVEEGLQSSLIVADNFVMAGMFLVLFVLAGTSFMRKHFPHPHTLAADDSGERNLAAEHWTQKPIGLLDIAKALAIAIGIVAVANWLTDFAGAHIAEDAEANMLGQLGRAVATNSFVWITLVSVVVATIAHKQLDKIHGPEEFGGYILYLYLFSIGLPADLRAVFSDAPYLFLFCLIIAVVNLLVTLILGKVFKLDMEDLLVCVNANLGGAPSAVAMAIAKGWEKLILPALLVSIWGYVIGTILGITMGEFLLEFLASDAAP